jgi:hypothetical protein
MGLYVNATGNGPIGVTFDEKCSALIEAGAKELTEPDGFVENLVCVVENIFFAAAAYIFSEEEYEDFNDPDDVRPKRWFVWDDVKSFAN